MAKKIDFDKVHKSLIPIVREYIEAIKEEYGEYMPFEKRRQLDSIEDYGKIIYIHDFGSINGWANDNGVHLPISVERIFKLMVFVPGYGWNKKHTTYSGEDLVINDNTFGDYLKHVIFSGTDAQGYFEDMLLHETMHFCGSGGSSALKEGINEFLTRKIALKKGFRTSACGYPKEVKVVYELEKIFGEEVINQIAFIDDEKMILTYLEKKLGKDAVVLYENVSEKMEKEFYDKYYKNISSYKGAKGIIRKIVDYKKIDYKEVLKMMDKYKQSKSKKIV